MNLNNKAIEMWVEIAVVANGKYKLSQSLPGMTEKTHNKLSQAIRCLCKNFLAYINIILTVSIP
jgi:hypothetical protein